MLVMIHTDEYGLTGYTVLELDNYHFYDYCNAVSKKWGDFGKYKNKWFYKTIEYNDLYILIAILIYS